MLSYNQTVLEGVATSFPQTEEIIEKGKVSLPNELDIKDRIRDIVEETDDAINIAIRLCLYSMKTRYS